MILGRLDDSIGQGNRRPVSSSRFGGAHGHGKLAAVVGGFTGGEPEVGDFAGGGIEIGETDELGFDRLAIVFVIEAVRHFEAAIQASARFAC